MLFGPGTNKISKTLWGGGGESPLFGLLLFTQPCYYLISVAGLSCQCQKHEETEDQSE